VRVEAKGAAVFGSERRQQSEREKAVALRRGLTAAQLDALVTLEAFGWRLAFVRRPLFRDPIPVLFHAGQNRHVVLQADGHIDAEPDLHIRR
jgi:hypothetical protein